MPIRSAASARRFDEVTRRVPPRRGGRGEPPGGGLALRLAHTTPYRWDSLLAFLGARAIPGVEEVLGGEYRRTVALPGAPGPVAVRPSADGGHLLATVRVSRAAALPEVAARLRRLLDLDADVQAIGAHLARDPLLAPLVAACPGLRVPGAWDAFKLAVRAILGQQVSVAAARTLAGRLAAAYGEPAAGGGLTFPGPERLAAARLERLGLTRRRAAAVRWLARAAAQDPSLLEGRGRLEEAVARLAELPGIGRWTAHYVAMRAMRQPDAFPDSDLGLLRAVARRGLRASPEALARRAESWRPWRAYAAMHLWTAEAGVSAPRPLRARRRPPEHERRGAPPGPGHSVRSDRT